MRSETVLEVGGMTCGACVRHVGAALRGLGGVSEVAVDLATGKVRIAHDAATPLPALVAAVEGAGYDVRTAGGRS